MVARTPRTPPIDAMAAVANASLRHDGIPQHLEPEELAEELESLDPERDLRVVEVGGVVVAYAWVWYHRSGERLERAHLFGHVHPEHRGRGIGRGLVTWGVERATELMRDAPPGLPRYVRAEVYEQVAAGHRLFVGAGFAPVRWFEELLRPLVEGDREPSGGAPGGYRLVAWTDERADELRDVRNESFADHWGSTPWTRERYVEVVTGFGTRTDLSAVAVHTGTGEVAAIALAGHYPLDEALTGRREGWIQVLGTRAAHRGSGLASALVQDCCRRFAAAGFTHAALSVDADSPTGASRLYRSLGFEPARRSTTYELVVG